MVIQVKNKGKVFTFENWECADPNFMWFRPIVEDGQPNGAAGILLLKFGEFWSVRFIGSSLSGLFCKSYDLMYPDGKEHSSIEEAKEETDKFLHRVSLLKVFL